MLLPLALLAIGAVTPTPAPAQEVPFCAILTERLTPAIVTEADGNDAISRIFPALTDYRQAFRDLNLGRASIDVNRLKRIYAQLQTDEAKMELSLKAPAADPPAGSDRELLTQMQIATNSILAEQQGVQRALKAFIDDEQSAEDATNGRVTMAGQLAENSAAGIADARAHIQDVGSHIAMFAAGAMSTGNLNEIAYARPMVANSQHILEQESYLHDLVTLAIERCYARRQASPPLPVPTPHP